MNLDDEKISSLGCYRVGFDKYSGRYLLETEDTFGNNRYFIITKEQYQWFDTQPDRLDALRKKCVEENNKSDIFYFSTWEKENTYEQNQLMWKYMYINMLLGKTNDEIHRKIGSPNKIIKGGNNIAIYEMSNNLEIQVVYDGEVCIDVIVEWKN